MKLGESGCQLERVEAILIVPNENYPLCLSGSREGKPSNIPPNHALSLCLSLSPSLSLTQLHFFYSSFPQSIRELPGIGPCQFLTGTLIVSWVRSGENVGIFKASSKAIKQKHKSPSSVKTVLEKKNTSKEMRKKA